MSNPSKIKLSKDGTSIDFAQSENLPSTVKKFRQSPEIEGLYRLIYENELRVEAYQLIDQILHRRQVEKNRAKIAQKAAKKSK